MLQESPLQWAIRKRYYAMAELLVTKARADLAHKSAQGSDALHLACKLGLLLSSYIHAWRKMSVFPAVFVIISVYAGVGVYICTKLIVDIL